MDFIEWRILLSYDAPNALYDVVNEDLDFTSIAEEEKVQFRIIFLTLLIHLEAKNIESCVGSTVSFELTLPDTLNPVIHLDSHLKEMFAEQNFSYMIQANINKKLFISNKIDQLHIQNFEADYEEAKTLYRRVKKRL